MYKSGFYLAWAIIIIITSFAQTVAAEGQPYVPDFLFHSSKPAPREVERDPVPCVSETIVDYSIWNDGSPHEICVMQGKTFRLAVEQVGFNMFISFDEGHSYKRIQKDSYTKIYVIPNSDTVVTSRRSNVGTYYYTLVNRDFLDGIRSDGLGNYIYTYPDGDIVSASDDIRAVAWGVSANGRYMAYTTAGSVGVNPRVALIDLVNSHPLPKYIGSIGYNNTYSALPNPQLAVSNDGSMVVSVGFFLARIWNVTETCIPDKSTIAETNSDLEVNYCPNQSLYYYDFGVTTDDIYSIRTEQPQLSRSNTVITFKAVSKESAKYIELRSGGYRYSSPTKYLALGDSYSSGEGDLTWGNESHYLPFTDVYGNYLGGIPRETCHVSDRSYPMLLAKDMNLAQGQDMYSVACSGAKIGDVYRYKLYPGDGVTNPNYAGQITQLNVGSGPRLGGLSNMAQLQQEAREKMIPGRVQQIEFVSKLKPEVMTVGMGGNDMGFGEFMVQCLMPDLHVGQTCRFATQDGRKDFAQMIYLNFNYFVDMYTELQKASPDTKIYVTGYPQMFSDKVAYCAEMPTLGQVERLAIHDSIAYLNAMIRNAALKAGVNYIDISDALTEGQHCGSSKYMTGADDATFAKIYTEYIKYGDTRNTVFDRANIKSTSQNQQLFLSSYSLMRQAQLTAGFWYSPSTAIEGTAQQLVHPNAAGHQVIHDWIASHLGEGSLYSKEPSEYIQRPDNSSKNLVAPVPDGYIKDIAFDPTDSKMYAFGKGYVSIGQMVEDTVADSVAKTVDFAAMTAANMRDGIVDMGYTIRQKTTTYFSLAADNIPPGVFDNIIAIKMSIYSDPVELGKMTRDSNGEFKLVAKLPDSVPVGPHTLRLVATLNDGRELVVAQPVFVEGPYGDIDGDGVKDTVDTCIFGKSDAVDVDANGVADNCDMSVGPAKQPVASAPVEKPFAGGFWASSFGVNSGSVSPTLAFATNHADDTSVFATTPSLPNLKMETKEGNVSAQDASKSSEYSWVDWRWVVAVLLAFGALGGGYLKLGRKP